MKTAIHLPRCLWILLVQLNGLPVAPAEEEANGARWTLESLAQRYGVTLQQEEAGAFQLNGKGVRIRGKRGDSWLEINRLRYRLNSAWEENGLIFRRQEVAGLLDPLLQPAGHIESGPFKEVRVEPVDSGGDKIAETVAAMMHSILEGYGIQVRSGASEAPEDNVPLLRLKAALEGDAKTSQCTLLAHSNPAERGGGIYPGEFFDAESLILATLIQTGLVLGPGAAGGGATDGGIDRLPIAGFALAPGPAVCVTWGMGLDPDHVAKSLSAGILRFQRFLGSDRHQPAGQLAFGRREVKLGRVDLRAGPGATEVQLLLSLSAKAQVLAEPATSGIDFPCRLFVTDQDGCIRMLTGSSTRVEWGSVTQVPGDAVGMITARAIIELPPQDLERLRTGFWGYAVWVIRNGVVEDRRSTPERLSDQLWRWEGS